MTNNINEKYGNRLFSAFVWCLVGPAIFYAILIIPALVIDLQHDLTQRLVGLSSIPFAIFGFIRNKAPLGIGT